jgi:hypothetical protein
MHGTPTKMHRRKIEANREWRSSCLRFPRGSSKGQTRTLILAHAAVAIGSPVLELRGRGAGALLGPWEVCMSFGMQTLIYRVANLGVKDLDLVKHLDLASGESGPERSLRHAG